MPFGQLAYQRLCTYTWKTMVLYVWNRGDLSTNQSNYLSNRLNTTRSWKSFAICQTTWLWRTQPTHTKENEMKKNCWKLNKSTIFDQFRSKLLIPTACKYFCLMCHNVNDFSSYWNCIHYTRLIWAWQDSMCTSPSCT